MSSTVAETLHFHSTSIKKRKKHWQVVAISVVSPSIKKCNKSWREGRERENLFFPVFLWSIRTSENLGFVFFFLFFKKWIDAERNFRFYRSERHPFQKFLTKDFSSRAKTKANDIYCDNDQWIIKLNHLKNVLQEIKVFFRKAAKWVLWNLD